MTLKRRFGNSPFADSYLPYGLFVLISLISLALAGCSGASPGAVVPEPTTGTLDMTPEPPQPTVTILADSDMVAAGDPVSYTVNASPAPIADLTVHVAYKNTGVELAEELPATATITIDAESGTAMRTVPTAPTSPDGTITASVTEGDGYTVGPAASASVSVTASSTAPTGPAITGPVIPGTVIRPPPPANSVTITAVTDSSVEEGNPVQFKVTAEPPPAVALTLSVRVTQTGPTRGIDDLPKIVTVMIPASSTSMELPALDTTDDIVIQSAGTVTATLTGVTPSTYSIGSPASATVTVTDDDAPLQNSVIIRAVTDSVVEGNPVRFMVTAEPAPAEDLTLSVSVTQTVPPPTMDAPMSVTILASNNSMALTLTTTNDGVARRAGTVTARLTDVTSDPAATYSIGSPDSATVTVTDRDRSRATINLLPDSVASGAILTIIVTMDHALDATEPVRVGVSDSGPPSAMNYDFTFAGDTSQTMTHTVATGHDAATDRITAAILPPPSGAPYVLGDPSYESVDVTD